MPDGLWQVIATLRQSGKVGKSLVDHGQPGYGKPLRNFQEFT